MAMALTKNNKAAKFETIAKIIYKAMCEDDTAKIDYFKTHIYFANAETMDKLLSAVYNQAYIYRIHLSLKMRLYIESSLLTYRFYSSTLHDNKALTDVQSKYNVRKKEAIEYMIRCMNNIISHDKAVDESFLFHVRIIIIVGNMLQHVIKGVPWIQFLFYLEQFIYFFVSEDEENMLYVTYITKKKLLYYIACVKDALGLQLTNLPKKKRNAVYQKIINAIKNDYETIKDVHTLKVMRRYLEICNKYQYEYKYNGGYKRNELEYLYLDILRLLQVLGEHFKNTEQTPKMSADLKQFFTIFMTEQAIADICQCRDAISHFKTIPTFVLDQKFYVLMEKCSVIVEWVHTYKRIILEHSMLSRINEIYPYPDDELELPLYYTINIQTQARNNDTKLDMLKDRISYRKRKWVKILLEHSYSNSIDIDSVLKYTPTALAQLICTIFKEICIKEHLELDNLGLSQELQDISPSTQTYTECGNILKVIVQDASIEEFQTNDFMKYAVELVTMIILKKLDNDKLLNENRHWINAQCPILLGHQLRNHLAHKSNIIKLLPFDETVILYTNATFLIKYLDVLDNVKTPLATHILGQESDYNINVFHQHSEQSLHLINQQATFLKNIASGLIDEVRRALQHGEIDLKANRATDGRNAMTVAAQTGQTAIMQSITDQMPLASNTRDGNGQTCLHIAVANNDRTEVEFILNNMPNIYVHCKDNQQRTALDIAAIEDNVQLVEIVLSHLKLVPEANKGHFQRIFLIAAKHNSSMVMRMLLNDYHQAIDINYADEEINGKTALHHAAENNSQEACRLLLNQSQIIINMKDRNGYDPIRRAIELNHLPIVKLLIAAYKVQHVDDIRTIRGETCLYLASNAGHVDIVRHLLDIGANINVTEGREGHLLEMTPLRAAIFSGYLKVVQLLVENGADIFYMGKYNFTDSKYVKSEIVEYLKASRTAHNDQVTFWKAVQDGDMEQVIELWQHGNINMKLRCFDDGKNALQYAFHAQNSQHLEMIKYIYGLDPSVLNHLDRSGQTILHQLIQGGNIEMVKFLLQMANSQFQYLYIGNDKGYKPMHTAIKHNRFDILKLLTRVRYGPEFDQ